MKASAKIERSAFLVPNTANFQPLSTKNFGSIHEVSSRKTNISMLAGGFSQTPKIVASSAYSQPMNKSSVNFRTNYRGIP